MKGLDGLRGDIKGDCNELGRERKILILKGTRRKFMRHPHSEENIRQGPRLTSASGSGNLTRRISTI